MRGLAAITFSILLAACSGRDPATAEAKLEPPPAQARQPGEVHVTEQAQRNGGIETQDVQTSSVNHTIAATGQMTVNEERTWTVGSHIEGRVMHVYAKAGDLVKKGSVLARLHSHEVHDARANHRRAVDELTRARSAADLAVRLRDRAARLLELRAGSRQDLEMAEAHVRDTQAVVRNAETELRRVQVHITEYLDISLEKDDDEVPLRAPESGLIIERKVSEGSVLSPGQEAFRLTDPSSVWMTANVSEADLQYLHAGQPVRVSVRAYPDRAFSGRILRLGEELDPVTRTLQVRVLVPNGQNLLKPEMYAQAEIEHGGSRDALFVPEAAVQDLNGSRVVFVRTGPDRFVARPIQVARLMNGRLEVTSGLSAGDRVAVRGSFVLKSQLLRSSLEDE